MQFVPNLQIGQLVQRYKRFFTDIRQADGSIIVAHCPNTGPMTGLLHPGTTLAFSLASTPRKLGYTWEMAHVDGVWVGANTQWPNRLVKEAFEKKRIPALNMYDTLQSEVRVGDSRLDFYATCSDPEAQKSLYIEVKNVHWRCGHRALFPDTVTTRGAKHLRALTQLVEQGCDAMMIYVVQRNDCQAFAVARDVDPDYAMAFDRAAEAGVQFLAYACEVSPEGISLGENIPIERFPHV